jgi:hypothetical protein
LGNGAFSLHEEVAACDERRAELLAAAGRNTGLGPRELRLQLPTMLRSCGGRLTGMARKRARQQNTVAIESRRRQLAGLTNAGKGRPRGAPNKVTLEVKTFATEVLNSPVYVASVWRRIQNDELPPAVECLFYYYAAGKPRERVELNADTSLAELILASIRHRDTTG